MKKLLIFDFDGVIVNTFDMCLKITQMYDPQQTADGYRRLMYGNIYATLDKMDRNVEARKAFDFFTPYTEGLMALKPITGIEIILKKAELIPIIVSSTISAPINIYLEKYALRKYFGAILGADVEKSKIVKLNKIVSENPGKELIFISDTLGDILEAKKAGIQTVAVTWGYHPAETLEKGTPLAIVNTIDELSQALGNY